MACFKLVIDLKKDFGKFFPFLNLLQRRYLIIKKYSFYFKLYYDSLTAINNVKSISFKLKYNNFDSYIVWTLTYVIPFDYNFDYKE